MGDSDRTRRTVRLILLGILGLGLLLRLYHFWAISGTAFPKIPLVFLGSDLHSYWEWAQRILAGDLLGRDTYHPKIDWIKTIAAKEHWGQWLVAKQVFHWAPLYPYGIAGLLALSKHSLPFVLLVQLLVGALQPLILFCLARRLFDERVGLVAAALTAFYGPFIFYQGVLLRDWLPPLLEPLALVALMRARDSGRGGGWLLAGASLSLALLTKETVLVLLPLVGLWLLGEDWPEWRRTVRAWVYLLAGLMLSLSPLVARNGMVGAPLFALSDRAAQAFIEGNAVDSSPVGLSYNWDTGKAIIGRADGSLRSVIRETLRTYQGDYGAFLRKLLRKLRGLVDPYEVPNNSSFYYGLTISPGLRCTLRYGFVFPLGIAGCLASLSRWRWQRLLYLYLLAVVMGQVFGVIVDRYRLTLVPVLILYAAAFLVYMTEALRGRQVARILRGLGLVLGIVFIQQVWSPLTKPEAYPRGEEYYLSAQVYASEGRFDRAVLELGRSREDLGQHPLFVDMILPAVLVLEGDYRALWAKQLLEQGNWEGARSQVELAATAYAQRPDLSYPYYNLGLLYYRLDERAKAKALFKRFLALEPTSPQSDRVRGLLTDGINSN